eukprot:ANDGO_02625.mRNA.1 hypothetical protein SAMD00019534_116630
MCRLPNGGGALWLAMVALAVVLLCGGGVGVVDAGILHVSLVDDVRPFVSFDVFGFASGGRLSLSVSSISIDPPPSASASASATEVHSGFLVLKVNSRVDLLPPATTTGSDCLLTHYTQHVSSSSAVYALPTTTNTLSAEFVVVDEGYYAVYFVSCLSLSTRTSFKATITERNPEDDGGYLPVGQQNLPQLLFAMCVLQLCLVVVWALVLRIFAATTTTKLHVVMGLVPLLRVLFLFFEAVRLREIEQEGEAATPYAVPYYLFAILESTVVFVVVILMGTGWSLTKPFLSDREKSVLLRIVLPLQLLADVAMIVTGELAPGSPQLVFWNNVSRVIDVVCCCAVLFPIVWSIRMLRDGPRVKAVVRLEAFRAFYVATVVYIYFTRIMVVLLRAVLSVRNEFMGDLLVEIASVLFYAYAGWSFRPQSESVYMALQEDDDDDDISSDIRNDIGGDMHGGGGVRARRAQDVEWDASRSAAGITATDSAAATHSEEGMD